LLAVMAAGVYFAGSIIWGAVGLVLVRGIVVVAYDIRKRTHFDPHSISETRESATCSQRATSRFVRGGIAQFRFSCCGRRSCSGLLRFLVSLMPSIPRYFIAGSIGERQLGLFSATAFIVSTGNLNHYRDGSVGLCSPCEVVRRRRIRRFNSLLIKLVGIAAALGVSGIVRSVFFGRLLLTLLYRPEYAEHTDVLIAMMIGGAMSYVTALIGSAITSARCFAPQIPATRLCRRRGHRGRAFSWSSRTEFLAPPIR